MRVVQVACFRGPSAVLPTLSCVVGAAKAWHITSDGLYLPEDHQRELTERLFTARTGNLGMLRLEKVSAVGADDGQLGFICTTSRTFGRRGICGLRNLLLCF